MDASRFADTLPDLTPILGDDDGTKQEVALRCWQSRETICDRPRGVRRAAANRQTERRAGGESGRRPSRPLVLPMLPAPSLRRSNGWCRPSRTGYSGSDPRAAAAATGGCRGAAAARGVPRRGRESVGQDAGSSPRRRLSVAAGPAGGGCDRR